MQELVGRLSTLDADASESLKVIAYFDALVDARAGRLALLRGGARLSGCPAGCVLPDEPELRVSPDGRRLPAAGSAGWPGRRLTGGGRVWIERDVDQHPIDMMVLERLVLAINISRATSAAPSSDAQSIVAVLVDPVATEAERADAAERLRLRADEPVRAVAVLGRPGSGSAALGVLATPWGQAGLALLRGHASWAIGPAGVGFSGRPGDLPTSWSSALIALRARRTSAEVVSADALGVVVALAEAIEGGAPVPPDVARVERITRDPETTRILEAVVDSSSIRGAAGVLGLHHSTLQTRLEQMARGLGFDPVTPHGRTRLDLSLALVRVRQARF